MCAQCTDAHLASAYVSIAVGNRLFRLSILYMETCHSFFQYLLIVFVDEQLVKARLLSYVLHKSFIIRSPTKFPDPTDLSVCVAVRLSPPTPARLLRCLTEALAGAPNTVKEQ